MSTIQHNKPEDCTSSTVHEHDSKPYHAAAKLTKNTEVFHAVSYMLHSHPKYLNKIPPVRTDLSNTPTCRACGANLLPIKSIDGNNMSTTKMADSYGRARRFMHSAPEICLQDVQNMWLDKRNEVSGLRIDFVVE